MVGRPSVMRVLDDLSCVFLKVEGRVMVRELGERRRGRMKLCMRVDDRLWTS